MSQAFFLKVLFVTSGVFCPPIAIVQLERFRLAFSDPSFSLFFKDHSESRKTELQNCSFCKKRQNWIKAGKEESNWLMKFRGHALQVGGGGGDRHLDLWNWIFRMFHRCEAHKPYLCFSSDLNISQCIQDRKHRAIGVIVCSGTFHGRATFGQVCHWWENQIMPTESSVYFGLLRMSIYAEALQTIG